MSAGLDSLASTQLNTLLTDRLGTELEPTVLFDYPTIESLANFVANEYSLHEISTNDALEKSLWNLYSELKLENKPESFVPLAGKSARRAVVFFAFAGSGSKHLFFSLSSHQHLCVCEDLCLMPFKTLVERNDALSFRRNNLQDGLVDAVKTLRNSKRPDIYELFGTVTNTYRALQEWCAPRILVDGTEAYSTVPQWSLTEAKNVFLDPNFVHLLRNPRGCLGDSAQGSDDIVKLEK